MRPFNKTGTRGGRVVSASLHGYGTVSPQFAAYIDPIGESLTQQMHEISALFSKPTEVRET